MTEESARGVALHDAVEAEPPPVAESRAEPRAATTVLGELERDGWTVLHDVKLPGRRYARISHVVVAGDQVYVIDTLSWAGSVTVTGGMLRHNGRNRQRAVTSVAAAAKAIATLAPTIPAATVQPVLCLEREEWVREQFGDVMICSTQNLVALLRARPETRPDFQLVDLLGQLESALRTQAGSVVPDEGEETRDSATRGRRRALALKAGLGVGLAATLLFTNAAPALGDRITEVVSNVIAPAADLPEPPADQPKVKKHQNKQQQKKAAAKKRAQQQR